MLIISYGDPTLCGGIDNYLMMPRKRKCDDCNDCDDCKYDQFCREDCPNDWCSSICEEYGVDEPDCDCFYD